MGMDSGQGLVEAATHVDTTVLDHSINGFDIHHKARSAKRTFYITQILAFLLLAGGLGAAFYFALEPSLAWLRGAAFVLFSAAIVLRLFAAAHLKQPLSRLAAPAHSPTYTILCPLYREANVVADLVTALERIDYPRAALDIKLIVEGDDADTIAAALAVSGAPHIHVVIVPPASPRTKPKALNAALAYARGDYVVVYDAEDRPHPLQLRAALAAFEDGPPSLACVQAPLDIDNAGASWISRQFAAEYAILFREIVPLLASLGLPFPLGGTSNHFRIGALRASGAWDPNNVSEDRANFANKLNRFRTHAFHIPFVSHSCVSAA